MNKRFYVPTLIFSSLLFVFSFFILSFLLEPEQLDTSNWSELSIPDNLYNPRIPEYSLILHFIYPPSWKIANLPESISYNHDISIDTDDPNFVATIHAAGPLNLKNCLWYEHNFSDVKCTVKKEKHHDIMEVKFYSNGYKNFTKYLIYPSRTFQIRGHFQTEEQAKLLKVILDNFYAKEAPFIERKEIGNITTANGNIVITPDFVSTLSLSNHEGTKFFEVRSLNSSGEFQTIYQKTEGDEEHGTARLLTSRPILYISNFKKEDKKTVFLDLKGNIQKQTLFESVVDQFSIPDFEKNSIVFINPHQDKTSAVNTDEVAYQISLNGDLTGVLRNSQLPLGIHSSSRLVGWSGDQEYIYITRIGWEGFEYADLWKANFENNEVEHIKGADKIALGSLSVVPNKDLALGIAPTEILCDVCMGSIGSGAPNGLILFDLKNNSSQIIYSHSESVILNPFLSPNGKKAFFSESSSNKESVTYVIDLDTGEKREITRNKKIHGMSYDGEKILVSELDQLNSQFFKYSIMDLASNSKTDFQIFLDFSSSNIRFLNCEYPLGFSCYYLERESLGISASTDGAKKGLTG